MNKIIKLIIFPLLLVFLLFGCAGQKKIVDLPENDHAVSDTAYISLDWLAESGNDMAKRIIDQIGDGAVIPQKDDDSVSTVNKEYQKLRYSSLNEYVLQNHYSEVMDLACGYSPRGLEFASMNISYTGCDFESVVNGISQICDGIIDEKKSGLLQYSAADVTNNEQMREAAKKLKGPVCIIAEGLFMYLDDEEAVGAIHNIAEILREKGGCFVTQDFSTKPFVTDVAEALFPGEGSKLYAASAEVYKDTADNIMHTEFGEDTSNIIRIMEKAGLDVEKTALFHDGENTDIPDLNEEQRERLEKVKKSEYMWVIKVAE